MADPKTCKEPFYHKRFRQVIDKMEGETVKRCTNTFYEGFEKPGTQPGAYCAVAWIAKQMTPLNTPVPREKVNDFARMAFGELPGILGQIYEINDDNPKWTWKQIASELRNKILPKIKH